MAAGQVRSITIPRGDYEVELLGCGQTVLTSFEARADRTLLLSCP